MMETIPMRDIGPVIGDPVYVDGVGAEFMVVQVDRDRRTARIAASYSETGDEYPWGRLYYPRFSWIVSEYGEATRVEMRDGQWVPLNKGKA